MVSGCSVADGLFCGDLGTVVGAMVLRLEQYFPAAELALLSACSLVSC